MADLKKPYQVKSTILPGYQCVVHWTQKDGGYFAIATTLPLGIQASGPTLIQTLVDVRQVISSSLKSYLEDGTIPWVDEPALPTGWSRSTLWVVVE